MAVDDPRGDGTASGSITVSTGGADGGSGGWWRLVAGVGVIALVVALAVLVVPGRYVPSVSPTVASLVRSAVLLGSGLLALDVLYSLLREATGQTSPDTDTRTDSYGGDRPVERPVTSRSGTGVVGGSGIGQELDSVLERIDGVVDSTDSRVSYRAHKVESNLRDLAVRVLVSETGCSPAEARERVTSGRWTDNPRAAALLSKGTVVLPVTIRLRDWAHGESFQRQVEATVDELARYMEVDDR